LNSDIVSRSAVKGRATSATTAKSSFAASRLRRRVWTRQPEWREPDERFLEHELRDDQCHHQQLNDGHRSPRLLQKKTSRHRIVCGTCTVYREQDARNQDQEPQCEDPAQTAYVLAHDVHHLTHCGVSCS
jgi:hypothetical protein